MNYCALFDTVGMKWYQRIIMYYITLDSQFKTLTIDISNDNIE